MVTLALDYDIDDPERELITQPSASLLRSPDNDIGDPEREPTTHLLIKLHLRSLNYDIHDCESIRTRNLLLAFWATASLIVSHDV